MKKLNLEPLPCKLDAQTITETLARLCGRQKKTKLETCEPKHDDEGSSSQTQVPPDEEADHEVVLERAQEYLKKKIEEGDPEAPFLLGQLYFEEGWYEDALLQFEKNRNDHQCCYQAAVMYYDGLGVEENP